MGNSMTGSWGPPMGGASETTVAQPVAPCHSQPGSRPEPRRLGSVRAHDAWRILLVSRPYPVNVTSIATVTWRTNEQTGG